LIVKTLIVNNFLTTGVQTKTRFVWKRANKNLLIKSYFNLICS